jgi:hypothetical protein
MRLVISEAHIIDEVDYVMGYIGDGDDLTTEIRGAITSEVLTPTFNEHLKGMTILAYSQDDEELNSSIVKRIAIEYVIPLIANLISETLGSSVIPTDIQYGRGTIVVTVDGYVSSSS